MKNIQATGNLYATNRQGEKICYDCCAKEDINYLLTNGKLQGYHCKGEDGKWYFSNWPGSFKIPVIYQRSSWHNFAGKNGRTDFWLKFNNNNYHGVQIGHDNQCATIKKVK